MPRIIFSHRLCLLAAIAVAGLSTGTTLVAAQEFSPTDLGTLGGNTSSVKAISADGRVIIGNSQTASGNSLAFRWTEAGNMQDLGTLGGGYSYTTAISADGRVIVGDSQTESGKSHAFRWTEAGNMQDLGTLGGSYSYTTAISADGRVIVGDSQAESGYSRAFRWTEAGNMQDIGTLGGNYSSAKAISADGRVIVGDSDTANRKSHAFRWTETGNMQDLGTLGGVTSSAKAISADGDVIVGNSYTASFNIHAFRWTESGNMQDLGHLGGDYSSATAISADGGVIIGDSKTASLNIHAFRWTEAGNMQDLGTLGGDYSSATAISADGGVIIGDSSMTGLNFHAFRWTESGNMQDLGTLGGDVSSAKAISADGNVIVGDSQTASGDIHAVLWKFSPSVISPRPIDVNNTIETVAAAANDSFAAMEMQRMGLTRLQDGCYANKAGETCYSIKSDINSFDGNRDIQARMNFGHAFTDNFSAGISIAHSVWRDLPDSFERNNNNIGGGLYAQWKDTTSDGSWYVRGALAANRYDVERKRSVLAYTEAGAGDSVVHGWGASLELGRNHSLSQKDSFGYYGGLRYSHLKMDGYTESNVAFAFSYSDVKSERTAAYLGANYTRNLTDKVIWSINGEIEQDLSYKDPSLLARADYIGAFRFGGHAEHTRANLLTTLSYAVSDKLSFDVTPYVSGTTTRDAAYGTMIGISGKF